MAQLSDLKTNLFGFQRLEDSCFLKDLEVSSPDIILAFSLQGLSGKGSQIHSSHNNQQVISECTSCINAMTFLVIG